MRDPLIAVGSWCHKTASISPGTELGRNARVGAGSRVERAIIEGVVGANCKIWRFAHIMAGAQIGNDCMIAQNVFVADSAKLGNNVRVQNNTCISRHVTIEDDVYIGAGVMFCNSVHPSAEVQDELLPITIKRGASIGCNVCLIGEVTIGEGAVVGAGAVVRRDIPAGAVAYGNPAVIHEKAKAS